MTKKGFLLGIPTSIVVGLPLAFYNAIFATLFGVSIGAMLGSSKKSGGAIGFLCSPIIFLSPIYIPLLVTGTNILFMAIIVGGSMLSIFTTVIIIAGIITGIIVGHVMVIYTKKLEEKRLEKQEELHEEKENKSDHEG